MKLQYVGVFIALLGTVKLEACLSKDTEPKSTKKQARQGSQGTFDGLNEYDAASIVADTFNRFGHGTTSDYQEIYRLMKEFEARYKKRPMIAMPLRDWENIRAMMLQGNKTKEQAQQLQHVLESMQHLAASAKGQSLSASVQQQKAEMATMREQLEAAQRCIASLNRTLEEQRTQVLGMLAQMQSLAAQAKDDDYVVVSENGIEPSRIEKAITNYKALFEKAATQ